jgi:hypothetical protein
MKKTITLILGCVMLCFISYAQSTIRKAIVNDHRNNSRYQRFIIDSLKVALNNGKYEKALSQNDVIGNDYNSPERIYGINANTDGSATPTNYHPVDGFKRTFCGQLIEHQFYRGRIDDDLNILIDVDKENPLLKRNAYQYEKHRIRKFAPFFSNDIYIPERIDSNWFFHPWNRIEGEVDIQDLYHSFFSNPKAVLQSDVCLYGSWVLELYDPSEFHLSAHKNNNEIHPIDQFWYKTKPAGLGNKAYVLNFLADNSGRFTSSGDYYRKPPDIPFKPWVPIPMDGAFYVAFEIDLKSKERLTYFIESLTDLGVKTAINDGKSHYLIHKKDTLITVQEGYKEKVNIDFENVGFKPLKGPSSDKSVLRGFLIIKSTLATRGHLRLRVEKAAKAVARQKVLVTVQKIKRLENNSYRLSNPASSINITDPDPVPAGFNEKQVFIILQSGNQFKDFLITNLEKGQEYTLNNITCTWEGILSDYYKFSLICKNGSSGKIIGKVNLIGKPDKPETRIEKTVVEFVLPDSPRGFKGQAHLFEITFKVENVSSTLNNNTK